MARHHDGARIAAERLPDIAREFDAAELFGDIAIGQRSAGRDGARDLVDVAVKLRHVGHIQLYVAEVDRLAVQQFDHAVDGMLHVGSRRGFLDIAVALMNSQARFFVAGHRQLHGDNSMFAPDDAAVADCGVEQCKFLVGHGSLHEGSSTASMLEI